ncbi:uncharacterized protein LOC132547222 [Ylistrum balloti]|uniref:uncharacterized protein LOC132547222 n=1 Tax=Ylistrum balloti TaxID=509963 RepID=UPI002905D8A2|nr:uncharacterized protein LOC132547222 [Ylistrum balloti]
MASREKKQVFQLSKEAVVLKPENEPEAEIDIPAGTFDSCELLVKFVDTTEISEEEALDDDDKRKSGDILMTSILDVSTSDGQQPNNDIEMKIPVTAKEQSEGVVVLTTSNPDPNLEEWTWDDLPAEIDKDGKAVFKIDHFSIYSGASKPLFESDPKAVQDEIRNSFLKMRKIEFIVGMKTPELDETKTDLVIACGTKRSIKMFKTTFDKRYTWFKLDSNTTLPMVPEGQIFQIVLHGNLKEGSDDNNMKLVFKGSGQESSRALEIISTSTDPHEMTGEIEIFQETKCPRPDTKVVVSIGCSCWQRMEERIIKSTEFDIKTKPMCKIPFNVTLRKRVPEVESGELTSEEVARPPPDVTWEKLNEAVRDLSHSEAKQLGYQLGLKPSHMKKIEDDTTREVEFSLNVIKRWRLFMAKNDMVSQLQGALEAIGRSDMIQVIKKKQSISN